MKKFKSSAVVAQILSLGIVFGGFACATKENTCESPEKPVVASFEDQNDQTFNLEEFEINDYILEEAKNVNLREDVFLSKHGKILDSLLDELEGIDLVEDFPQNVEDFADLLFSRNSEEFLNDLKSEVSVLSKENQIHEATVMLKMYLISREAVYSNLDLRN